MKAQIMDAMHAIVGLASAPSDVLDSLPSRYSGLMIIGLAFLAGAGSMAWVGDLGSHEERIGFLEDDTIKIRRLDQGQDSLVASVDMIEAMVYQLYCDRYPERCEGRPAGNGGA